MTVETTTNLNLSKPDDTEIGRLWADEDELHKANNVLIDTALGSPELLTYEPTLYATTTDPTIGDGGEINGWYKILPNDWIMGWVTILFGTGGGGGSGNWRLSLPENRDTTIHSGSASAGLGSIIGEGYFRDNSVTANSQLGLAQFTSDLPSSILFLTEADSSVRVIQDNSPFTWTDGDRLTCSFFYKAVFA